MIIHLLFVQCKLQYNLNNINIEDKINQNKSIAENMMILFII